MPVMALSDDCIHDEVDCTGKCGRFIDADSDEYCDYSELSVEDNIEIKEMLSTDLVNYELVKESKEKSYHRKVYVIFPVLFVLVVFYIFTSVLSRKKIISILNHRRFWNVLLLLSFLGVAFSGVFLVLRINYGININWPFNMLYWHVEIGIIMSIISIFHIMWHWRYFKIIFKFNKK